jgi:hypothetical protein
MVASCSGGGGGGGGEEGESVYRGVDMQTVIGNLLPGREYLVQVRAANRVGWGEWSSECEFMSGAGCPDAPHMPVVTYKTSSSNSIQVCIQFNFFLFLVDPNQRLIDKLFETNQLFKKY